MSKRVEVSYDAIPFLGQKIAESIDAALADREQEIDRLTAALKDAERERERRTRLLDDLYFYTCQLEKACGVQGTQAEREQLGDRVRSALQEPAPQGAEALGRSQPELTTPKDGS